MTVSTSDVRTLDVLRTSFLKVVSERSVRVDAGRRVRRLPQSFSVRRAVRIQRTGPEKGPPL